MVHTDERAIAGEREGFGVHDPHEQRAGETRAGRHRDGVDGGWGEAGLRERALDHRRQRGEMRAARKLGHDTAEDLVNVLRQDDETRELSADEDRRGRLVARRLDAEDGVSHAASLERVWCGVAA